MFRNYLKTAWRNIIRHKGNTAINVIGLALGMTCCLFIFLWVKDEKSIDNFHANGENIFTIYQTTKSNGKTDGTYRTPIKVVDGHNFMLLEGAKEFIPEIKAEAYYATGYELPWGHLETIQVGEKKLKLEGSRAGEDFFKIFSYPLLQGNAETALKNMNGIAISHNMANIYFGSPENAMGKSVRYENRINFIVTAVFENLTRESSLHFDFLLNWEAQKRILEWSSPETRVLILLAKNAEVSSVEKKLNEFMAARIDNHPDLETTIGLQRFGDQYLENIFVNGKPLAGRIEYVRIFTGVAIFILIIACINFMNLAAARSEKRAKEVGLRKVVGSSKTALIGQFFSESISFSFIAMLLAMLLFYLLLPAFNQFTGKDISYPGFQLRFWLSLIGLMLITGIIAGSYPAFYLSSLQPIRVLKGVAKFTKGSVLFRRGLTVFQFVLSIVLIVATIVIYRQTSYTQHMHLGYNRENLIYIRIEGELSSINNYLRFKQEASKMPGVAMVDRSSEVPHAMDFVVYDDVKWQGKEKNASVGFKPASVGFDFLKIMDLKVKEGRGFDNTYPTDSADAFMINEEAVKEMGLKNPIGKWISAWNKKGHIIGVLKDFHTQSLHEPIKPILFDIKEYEYFGVIIARTKPGMTREALVSLAKLYQEINPKFAFAYQFADEEYTKLYSSEILISKLSILFSVLAILISCMGLLGLVMFSAEQRMKEISMRKVLGASLSQIITLFSTDFMKLIIIAFLIAGPLAWFAMNSWLQDFAYKLPLSWWIFAMAGFIAILIALFTICIQAFKTARTNPIVSLRSE
jgi:ABC-type antimicrobial peptide transport system permease subunit